EFTLDLHNYFLHQGGEQLYLIGNAPVMDQGLIIGRTMSIQEFSITTLGLRPIATYREGGDIVYTTHISPVRYGDYLLFLINNRLLMYHWGNRTWEFSNMFNYIVYDVFLNDNRLYARTNVGLQEVKLEYK